MKIIDLTHPLSSDMPVYPGTDQPQFNSGCTFEKDGFREKEITMFSHTGTHIDAPAHMLEKGKTLDKFGTDKFIGKGFLLDCRGKPEIDINLIKEHEKNIRKADFLIINTGWSSYWGMDKYFSGFPVLTQKAAKLVADCSLKGFGFDAISADPVSTESYEIHKILMAREMILIENLCNLDSIKHEKFVFSCFPLNIQDADGSPVRAVALAE